MKIIPILILVLLICGLIGYGYYEDNKEINVGIFKINGMDLKSITDPLPEGNYILCSLKKQDGDAPCVTMFKGNLDG